MGRDLISSFIDRSRCTRRQDLHVGTDITISNNLPLLFWLKFKDCFSNQKQLQYSSGVDYLHLEI